MKQNKAVARVWVWSFVTILLIGVLMVGLNGFSFAGIMPREEAAGTRKHHDETYTTGGASLAASSIRQIDIDWIAGAVQFLVYDGDTIQLSETASRQLASDEEMRYQVKDGKLTILFWEKQERSILGISLGSWNVPEKTLEVLIPATLALDALNIDNASSEITLHGAQTRIASIEIETASGDVTLEGFGGRELEIESASGEVSVHGDFDTLDLDSASGNITVVSQGRALEVETASGTLSVDGAFERIEASSASGSQTYRLGGLPDSIRASSASGNITVHLPQTEGFTGKLNTASGTLSSDFASLGDKREATVGNGKASLRFDTASGNIALRYDAALAQDAPSPESTAAQAPTGDPIPAGQRGF